MLMFSVDDMRKFYELWLMYPWNVELTASTEEIDIFYARWLCLVRQIILEGYDEDGKFFVVSQKLQRVLESPPTKISFKFPFVGEGRDISDILDMLEFFNNLQKVCTKKTM